MHEEWSNPWSSWNDRRLMSAAVLVAVALLIIGIGTAQLLTPASVAAEDGAGSAAVAGAVEMAEPPEVEVETDIGDAVASLRQGPFEPAPVEHLALVHVSVSVCGARSTGSGVVVADGLLLTAAHVVGNATLVRVDQGGITVTGEVLGVFADRRDLALIAVDAPMATPLAPGVIPAVGQPITLVGHPDGGPRTSLVGARVEVASGVTVLAGAGEIVGVDVPIQPGISGGPALDASGAVIGVVVAKEAVTETALVVAVPDLATIDRVGLVPGTCIESA